MPPLRPGALSYSGFLHDYLTPNFPVVLPETLTSRWVARCEWVKGDDKPDWDRVRALYGAPLDVTDLFAHLLTRAKALRSCLSRTARPIRSSVGSATEVGWRRHRGTIPCAGRAGWRSACWICWIGNHVNSRFREKTDRHLPFP